MERSKLDRALEEAKAGGIHNIVALRGGACRVLPLCLCVMERQVCKWMQMWCLAVNLLLASMFKQTLSLT
jgi:hypothetical protein